MYEGPSPSATPSHLSRLTFTVPLYRESSLVPKKQHARGAFILAGWQNTLPLQIWGLLRRK
jgi:hypothetical protein